MNIHIGASEESHAELLELSAVKHNIISQQSSKPNIVIVQDSLLGAYRMTRGWNPLRKDQFFNIACYGSDWDVGYIQKRIQHIRKVLKAKGKPVKAFTGKGLFSLLLPEDFNYTDKNKADPNEPVVRICRGVLYEGTITKANLGGSKNSLILLIHKEYGKDVVSTFVDNVQFITNQWLLIDGFSIGIEDCMATKTDDIEHEIKKCLEEADEIKRTTYHPGIREVRIIGALGKAKDIGLKIAKDSLKEDNNFKSTVTSGSKGAYFNIAQITGLLGQQNLGGKRIPYMLNHGKRSLPHYPLGKELPTDLEYESRGFIKHSFIHGLNPREFWFHAMTGREGVCDTAMGTAKSGYIQRKIVKCLEDIQVRYDGTVRNTTGSIFQFAYGEDGFDPACTVPVNGEPQCCNVSRIVDKLNMKREKI
jgi:DNA-directed RNA polymerase beta' subunit